MLASMHCRSDLGSQEVVATRVGMPPRKRPREPPQASHGEQVSVAVSSEPAPGNSCRGGKRKRGQPKAEPAKAEQAAASVPAGKSSPSDQKSLKSFFAANTEARSSAAADQLLDPASDLPDPHQVHDQLPDTAGKSPEPVADGHADEGQGEASSKEGPLPGASGSDCHGAECSGMVGSDTQGQEELSQPSRGPETPKPEQQRSPSPQPKPGHETTKTELHSSPTTPDMLPCQATPGHRQPEMSELEQQQSPELSPGRATPRPEQSASSSSSAAAPPEEKPGCEPMALDPELDADSSWCDVLDDAGFLASDVARAFADVPEASTEKPMYSQDAIC